MWQYWLKSQFALSIYLNTILVFDQVDWALLPLSTYTLVPLLVAGNCLPYHQPEFLAIHSFGGQVALVYRRPGSC